MPRKIRELKRDLLGAGFKLEGGRGKGSHAVYSHPRVKRKATISGKDGDDASAYQEKHVREKIKESQQ